MYHPLTGISSIIAAMSAKRHKNLSFWDSFLPLPLAKIPSEDLRQTQNNLYLAFKAFKQHHFMPRHPQAAQGTRHGVNWEPVSVIHGRVRIHDLRNEAGGSKEKKEYGVELVHNRAAVIH